MNAGMILDELYTATSATDDDSKKNVLRKLNLSYYDLAGAASFQLLRKTISFTSGSYLPSDLVGIDCVYDGDGNEYFPRDRGQVETLLSEDPVRRYYYDDIVLVPSQQRKGLTINKASSTISVTNPVLTSDYIGEYMTIGKELGFYKITAANTILPRYMGPKLTDSYFQIRPEGTKQLRLVDESGDADTSTVTVDYWAYPPPIYDDSQMILLPTTRALFLRALIRCMGIDLMNEWAADRYREEYQDAMAELLDRNPTYTKPARPRNRLGSNATWGSRGQ